MFIKSAPFLVAVATPLGLVLAVSLKTTDMEKAQRTAVAVIRFQHINDIQRRRRSSRETEESPPRNGNRAENTDNKGTIESTSDWQVTIHVNSSSFTVFPGSTIRNRG
jgi:hypothetical protein